MLVMMQFLETDMLIKNEAKNIFKLKISHNRN